MNLVDSSGWLEFFSESKNASIFAKPIENLEALLVPSITITEVFKKILQTKNEPSALKAAAHMRQGRVVDLDTDLALSAAKIGYDLRLPLADSIILATARLYKAVLWTQDEDFKGLEGVRYIPMDPRPGSSPR